MNKTVFETGLISTTSGVYNAIKEFPEFAVFCQNALTRHKNQDWGDLEDEDKELNNEALLDNERILSRYDIPKNQNFPNHIKVYIITECDRSLTTILFPYEY